MAEYDIPPEPHPSLNIPPSDSTVEVSIVNTTTDLVVPAWTLVHPVQKGHETMNLPTFAFLVKNKKFGKTILFDLGCRKDWWNHAPATKAAIVDGFPAIEVTKSINEILREGGQGDNKIDAVVWSHWHFDHTGNMSLFPESTGLYVGPGFKQAFMPGFPAKQDSPMLETDLIGRSVHEVTFDKNQTIGAYPSHDLFGDGSFYLLDVPGHAIGHISGLARTTSSTFVLIGGDVCHFGGVCRPNPYMPMPSHIPSSVPMDARFHTPCPCSLFEPQHRDRKNARTSPFYVVTQDPKGWYADSKVAQESVHRLQDFDADERIFVCLAHDGGLLPVVDLFPNGTLNDWKAKGWKESSMWGFLNELPNDGKPGRPWIAPGIVKDGAIISKEEA